MATPTVGPVRRTLARLMRFNVETSDQVDEFDSFAEFDGVRVDSLQQVYALLAGMGPDVRVTRHEANRLPEVVGVRNKLTAVITSMPLRQTDRNGQLKVNPWLNQLNPARPNAFEIANTVHDAFYEGVAYWQVTARGPGSAGPGTGYPTATQWVRRERVSVDPQGTFYIDGRSVPASSVIEFKFPFAGVLHEGAAGSILDALRIQRTAALFTNNPFPLGYFQSRDGAQPDPEEVATFLGGWATARRANAWAYVPPELELNTVDIDPAKLQLAAARNEAIKGTARGTGADLEDLGIATTSRVYLNQTQQRKDMIDFQVSLYTTTMWQRLSMSDCTPGGNVVGFSTDEFLSVDEATRMEIYLHGLQAGAFADVNEIRAAEGKPPLTDQQRLDRAHDLAALKVAPTAPETSGVAAPATAPGK